eukprot:31011-Pelagococcus_subviridis.AAC.2
MDAINFEKKQLAAQWKASLVGVSKRDDALKAAEGALRDQAETRRAVESETEGYKKNIREAEAENEQMSAILRKVEKEAEALTKDFEKCRTRKEVRLVPIRYVRPRSRLARRSLRRAGVLFFRAL